MKKRSTLHIEDILFRPYTADERNGVRNRLERLGFSRGHDFVYSPDMIGIAVELRFVNFISSSDKQRGVRHKVGLTLIDATVRAEVASRDISVYIPVDEIFRSYYIDFPLESIDIQPGHTYKLVVRDLTKSLVLGIAASHLYDERRLGDHTDWYTVFAAGIRPAWETQLYRSLTAIDRKRYFVRFEMRHNFGRRVPSILPEVEIRLHFPDKYSADVCFKEPVSCDIKGEAFYVESLFIGNPSHQGAFYAELCCMGSPIAGFVFTTDCEAVSGTWYEDALLPLADYSQELADARLHELLPQSVVSKSETNSDDEFIALVKQYIASELSPKPHT